MARRRALQRARGAVQSRAWHWGVTAIVVLDLGVVLAEVALAGVHPPVAACTPPPPAAEHAAEGLHATTLTLLALLNADWVARAALLGPGAFFGRVSHWLDAGLAASALALELALHGAAAVGSNLLLILLRLARVGHAFAELAAAEAAERGRGAAAAERRRGAARAWRLAAAAAVRRGKEDEPAAVAGGRRGEGEDGLVATAV